MTDALRHYQRTHSSVRFPLVELRARLDSGKTIEGDDLAELSEELGLPPSAIRAAASYYSDLHSEAADYRVCQGTSCMLAGADSLRDSLGEHKTTRSVYCLGYCDRSPAVMRSDGGVVTSCQVGDDPRLVSPEIPRPEPPSIRCRAHEPIVTERILHGDHSDLKRALEAHVYDGLRAALAVSPTEVITMMERSGETGRGGAAFSTGTKWKLCAQAEADKKYVVANGDEGDPGSYIDRVLMEMDPHTVLEGMAICAYAVGASEGIVFIRSEYPKAVAVMNEAIVDAREAGFLGHHVLGSTFDFDVSVFPAMGSYVCGEETAMLNAIEGHRGEVSLRPPYPTETGLFGKPTVTNNVETLVNVPWIIRRGGGAYRELGTASSSGTKAICLNQGFARPGIVEVEFGDSLKDIIESEAGGARDGKRLAAAIVGGPMGSVVTPERWEVPICYEAMGNNGIALGHGGIVAVPEGVDWKNVLIHWLQFMSNESCGKCVPCRVGSQRALERAESIQRGEDGVRDELIRLLDLIEKTSLCGFGQLLPGPMREILDLIPESGGGNGD